MCLSVPALGEVVAQDALALAGGLCIPGDIPGLARHLRLGEGQALHPVAVAAPDAAKRRAASGRQAGASWCWQDSAWTLVLPFGLAMDAGVARQVFDNRRWWSPALQDLCCRWPAGLVPLSLEAALHGGLRAGETLKVMFRGGRQRSLGPLSLSLKGFGDAFDRVSALEKRRESGVGLTV